MKAVRKGTASSTAVLIESILRLIVDYYSTPQGLSLVVRNGANVYIGDIRRSLNAQV
jgi:hypothetical protein